MATPEKSLRQLMEMQGDEPSPEIEFLAEAEDPGVEVAIGPGRPLESVAVVEMDDGSAVVDIGDGAGPSPLAGLDHDANLAEHIPEQDLRTLAVQVDHDFQADLTSRSEWERQRVEGLKSLGMKYEEKDLPWPGACSVVHPLLSEAIVRFQAQTIGDILPASGPVRTKVLGAETPERLAKAQRVERYMNYQITEEMPEYRPETEKLLFGLALDGAAFRKLYPDATEGNRPCSMYVPAVDLVVNYDAPDIRTAERVSHRMRLSDNQVLKMQLEGRYRMISLTAASRETNQIQQKVDEIQGVNSTDPRDSRRVIVEQHGYFDLGEDHNGLALPYVVTLDKTNREILSVYRNWDEDDPARRKLQHFVHYDFVPALGFYGLGLAHLVGPSAKAATSLLQQLVDAGTLSNLPGGLKDRNLRITRPDDPIGPGEWRDVDTNLGTLKESLMPLPAKEPSTVLFNLMAAIVEDGRRFASMADLKVSDMNQEAPVGTTLAIMERALKMQSAVEQRVHAGLKQEFKLLAAMIVRYTDPAYPYDEDPGKEIKREDFDGRVDIVPVADPNASTLAQKVMQYQTALQAAQMHPDVYDIRYLHRSFVETIGMRNADKIVPTPEEIEPFDPITENQRVMTGEPVDAKEWQDHSAHLRVHLALQQDPGLQQMLQNSPMGGQVSAALDAHIRQHTAFQYRREIEQELGVPLPPLGQPLPADVEKRLSTLAADAADQLTGKKQAQAQAAQNAAMQQDPIIQQKERELSIREQEVQRKAQKDQADIALRERQMMLNHELERLRLAMEKEEGDLDRQQRREKEIIEELNQLADRSQREVIEGARIAVEAAKAAQQGLKTANRGGRDG